MISKKAADQVLVIFISELGIDKTLSLLMKLECVKGNASFTKSIAYLHEQAKTFKSRMEHDQD